MGAQPKPPPGIAALTCEDLLLCHCHADVHHLQLALFKLFVSQFIPAV